MTVRPRRWWSRSRPEKACLRTIELDARRNDIRRGTEVSLAKPSGSVAMMHWLVYLGATCIAAALLLCILLLNDGLLVYTLDDPYIHLALSEEIFRGGYGVNSGEPSAAASSILYPALLALGAWSDWHAVLPLAINLLALLGSVAVVLDLLVRFGFCDTPRGRLVGGGVVVLFALATNQIGVVFSGMEHSLHILVTLVIVRGLVTLLEDGRIPWWLMVAIVFNPLIRYEGLSASLGAAAVLGWRGRRVPAAFAVFACFVTLGGFSAFLVSQGLAPLPSSVLVKSTLMSSGIDGNGLLFLKTLAANLLIHLVSRYQALVLLVLCLLVLCRLVDALRRSPDEPEVPMAGFLLLVGGAHLLMGRFGWFDRYELYALIALTAGNVYLWREPLRALTRRLHPVVSMALAGAALFWAGWPYLWNNLRLPVAANNIYEQQYQMHRFITDYHKGSVAVNDLGWAAYRNDGYVLDLWGLGSEEVRRNSADGRSKALLDRLVRDHGVGLAIIYEKWFPGAIPGRWTRVAELHLSRDRVTPAGPTVAFFSTDPSMTTRILGELRAFRVTLPPGVRLDILDEATGAGIGNG